MLIDIPSHTELPVESMPRPALPERPQNRLLGVWEGFVCGFVEPVIWHKTSSSQGCPPVQAPAALQSFWASPFSRRTGQWWGGDGLPALSGNHILGEPLLPSATGPVPWPMLLHLRGRLPQCVDLGFGHAGSTAPLPSGGQGALLDCCALEPGPEPDTPEAPSTFAP